MKKLTSSFSTKQKPKSHDLIVSINTKKEILFSTKDKTFMHLNKFKLDKFKKTSKINTYSTFNNILCITFSNILKKVLIYQHF